MAWTKRIDYTLWPVGQGLFSHADLWVGGRPFRLVYDCGTFNSQKQIGAAFLAPMAGRKVDLLVVSHFHWDHISRIPQLLDAAGGAAEVWIPYLSPQQRVLAAVTTALGGLVAEEETAFVANIAGLAGSAREYFESRGSRVREVGGPEDGDLPPGGDEPEGPPPWEADEGDTDSPAPVELRLQTPRRFGSWSPQQSLVRASQSGLEALPRHGRPETPVRLLTWIRPVDESLVERTLETLRDRLAAQGLKLDREDLSEPEKWRQNGKALTEALRYVCTRSPQLSAGELYKALNADLNAGSLFLLVEPTRPWHHRTWSSYGTPWPRRLAAPDAAPPAFLWTGDATREVLDELTLDALAALRRRLANVVVHQVPHHGAAACLSLPWLRVVGRGGAVISCGRSNRFRHPSPEAVLRYGALVVQDGGRAFEASMAWR